MTSARPVARPRASRLRSLLILGPAFVAATTDIAEVVGGALALQLLFGLPLVLGGIVVGAVSLLLLALQSRRGARAFEGVMLALLGTLAIGFAAGLLPRGVDWPSFGSGLVPRFQ